MKPSLETVCVARVAIAKEIQRGNRDPRLRAAFNELRQVLTDESEAALAQDSMPSTRKLIADSHTPAMVRRQAD